jgi:CIC family chloride channel protein
MGAMVGGGTGAAMTAVTMIFEMTRDYNIVLPMILAVAVALGTRRLLSRENMYTMKLARRGHPVPKALHTNMFLVRGAADIMDRDVLVLNEDTFFKAFLAMSAVQGGLRHVVVTRAGKITGALRVDASLRRALAAGAEQVTLGELSSKSFVLVNEAEAAFKVIQALTDRRATLAIVIRHTPPGEPEQVAGIITKEQIADTVASSVALYPRA